MKAIGLVVFAFLTILAGGLLPIVFERYNKEEKIIVDLDLCWKGVGYQAWNDNIGEWQCFMTEREYRSVR
jgi:hypothetical protein